MSIQSDHSAGPKPKLKGDPGSILGNQFFSSDLEGQAESMARQPRMEYEGAFYHVIARGAAAGDQWGRRRAADVCGVDGPGLSPPRPPMSVDRANPA